MELLASMYWYGTVVRGSAAIAKRQQKSKVLLSTGEARERYFRARTAYWPYWHSAEVVFHPVLYQALTWICSFSCLSDIMTSSHKLFLSFIGR